MKIMVSLDGSESSMRALEFIISRPWADDDQFMIVSVVEPDKGDMSVAQAMTNPDEVFFANAEKLLAKVKDKLDEALKGRSVNTAVLSGPVIDSLVDCAKEYSADLIVMGSEGRRGVSRLLLGSVAEGVLRNAPCSVQIVRRKL
ncbi:MAG: universal stress protein [Cyanobacteria bacterium SZAS TMP-1]|nr:universal stress protein [Cyanobacteria bacterium SZAS TMP-1]